MNNLLRGAFPENSLLRADTLRRAADRASLYVIFLTARSGSGWLTDLATNTGSLGCPHEWFNYDWVYTDRPALGFLPPRLRGVGDINAYVDQIVDEGHGVAGVELSIFQALMLYELIEQPVDLQPVKAFFYLRRRDIVAQAISLYRSIASQLFHSYERTGESIRRFNEVPYSYEGIWEWLRSLIDDERRFRELFDSCGIAPTSFFYEDLLENPLAILRQISEALGVTPPDAIPKTSLEIMRDETSKKWQAQFLRELPPDILKIVSPEVRNALI